MHGLPGVCVWGVVVPIVLLWLHAGVGEAMTTSASQTAILNRFNELRAAFSVAPVTWDDTAEGVAQGWPSIFLIIIFYCFIVFIHLIILFLN